jgi:hypothetical protein
MLTSPSPPPPKRRQKFLSVFYMILYKNIRLESVIEDVASSIPWIYTYSTYHRVSSFNSRGLY